MKGIVKWRWAVLALWIVGVVALTLTAPSLQQLVRDKGQITVPAGYSSAVAQELLDEKNKQAGKGHESSLALVLHTDHPGTGDFKTRAAEVADRLDADSKELHITGLIRFDREPDLQDKLVSKDGATILIPFSVETDEQGIGNARKAIEERLLDVKADHYLTGSGLIQEDMIVNSEEGLKKTEWVTVLIILVILLIVFRSAVAPFIPLVTVGISYVAAQSVVAVLADRLGFPLSTFTQIFMVAVMFGIGTDYCILLISRFKEELGSGKDKIAAVLETYRTAGKTVLYAGIAVLVGFCSIAFSQFSLYRSGVAVAVGVLVLMVALVTLVPFFMATLGAALFWPGSKKLEHPESRLWGFAGGIALKRPIATVAVLVVLIVPSIWLHHGKLSYNLLEDLGGKYESVKGFNLIADAFGQGEAMPGTIAIESDKPLDNPDGMAMIETLSRNVAALDGVASVRSATRPTGEPLEQLKVSGQAKSLADGIGKSNDGLRDIRSGLHEAASKLSGSLPDIRMAADESGQLVDGTAKLTDSLKALQGGLTKIASGIDGGANGAANLRTGLDQTKQAADELAAGNAKLLASYQQMADGLGSLSGKYAQIETSLQGVSGALATASDRLRKLGATHPELQQDADYAAALQAVAGAAQGASKLDDGLKALNAQLQGIAQGMKQANGGLDQARQGQLRLADGLAKLRDGAAVLENGLRQASAGQKRAIGGIPQITGGLGKVNEAQAQMQEGYRQMADQLSALSDGLATSTDGIGQVSDGLAKAEDYLQQLASSDSDSTGVLIPDEMIHSADFAKVLDSYLSKDRKIVTLDVVFKSNPYAIETLDHAVKVEGEVGRTLQGTPYAHSVFGLGGVSATNADLRSVSAADYSRTMILMLCGIAAILIILLRSLVMPLYLLASLLLTYYMTLGISETLFVNVFDYTGLSWAVPFFAFVLLLALGVDYSIFMMGRFNEYRSLSPEEAIWRAMRSMGAVIISAALILGGTFAAMVPSGVLSLLQIATLVITGLFLYAVVFLPFFIPVMVKLFGQANGWPFPRRGE